MSAEFAPQVVADLKLMVAGSLRCWGLASDTRIELLNLSENATFALSDSSSRRELIVRVHRVGYSSVQEIRSELAWIEALCASSSIDTAAPVPGVNHDCVQILVSPSGLASRHAVAFKRLKGVEPTVVANRVDDAAHWFERLGELTARMHIHARSWKPPAHFLRRRLDLEGLVGLQAHWGPWRAAIGLDASGAQTVQRALKLIAQRLESFGTGPARFGLIHADLRLANLLVDEKQLRIIDFDDCGFGWYMYDFASAVSFIEEQPLVPSLLQAWIDGYSRVSTLSKNELAIIPALVVLRRIVLSAWLASHQEIPFAHNLGAAHTQGTVELAGQLLSGTYLHTALARHSS